MQTQELLKLSLVAGVSVVLGGAAVWLLKPQHSPAPAPAPAPTRGQLSLAIQRLVDSLLSKIDTKDQAFNLETAYLLDRSATKEYFISKFSSHSITALERLRTNFVHLAHGYDAEIPQIIVSWINEILNNKYPKPEDRDISGIWESLKITSRVKGEKNLKLFLQTNEAPFVMSGQFVLVSLRDAIEIVELLARAGHIILGYSVWAHIPSGFIEQGSIYWKDCVVGHESDENLVQVCATEAKENLKDEDAESFIGFVTY